MLGSTPGVGGDVAAGSVFGAGGGLGGGSDGGSLVLAGSDCFGSSGGGGGAGACRSGEGERNGDLPGGSLWFARDSGSGGGGSSWSSGGGKGMEAGGIIVGRRFGDDDVARLAKRVGRDRFDVRGVRKGECLDSLGLGIDEAAGGGGSA